MSVPDHDGTNTRAELLADLKWRSNMRHVLRAAAVIVLAAGLTTGATLMLQTKTAAPVVNSPESNLLGRHVRGNPSARITVVEYVDYECPPCATYYGNGTIDRLLQKYRGTIRYEFRHFPLPIHPNAVQAAVVAEAAGLQGKFWEMHNALLGSQPKWAGSADAQSVFVELASQIGLELGTFRQAMDSAEIRQVVVQQQAAGKEAGIAGTPMFLLNGKKLDLIPSFEEFDAQVEELLKTMKR
jgi:protein-disulfide isomerase